MSEVLMNPDAEGPVIHYHMVRGGQKRNITVLETGTIGGEYIKTYGHYHIGEPDETYRFRGRCRTLAEACRPERPVCCCGVQGDTGESGRFRLHAGRLRAPDAQYGEDMARHGR